MWNNIIIRRVFTNHNIVYNANATNLQISSVLQNAGWDGLSPVDAAITIGSGYIIGASSISNYALTVPVLPITSRLSIYLSAGSYIIGAGGTGGNGATYPSRGSLPNAGGPGGNAILLLHNTTIYNNGIIAGGGGGGGGSGNTGCAQCYDDPGGAGGGGAGSVVGIGGIVADKPVCYYGNNGTITNGGGGGSPCPSGSGEWAQGYAGGRGGDLGRNGSPGTYFGGTTLGGLPGYFIYNIGHATIGTGIGQYIGRS